MYSFLENFQYMHNFYYFFKTTQHTNVEGANNNMLSVNNGEAIKPTESDVSVTIEEVKEKKKHTFKGTATAVRLAASKLSPKTQRKKANLNSLMKVCMLT